MKVYLSWAGVEMLRHEPIGRFPKEHPMSVPVRLTTNEHQVVIFDPSGVIWFNDVLAGMYDEGKPKSIIDETFMGHNQTIVAVVDYQEIS